MFWDLAKWSEAGARGQPLQVALRGTGGLCVLQVETMFGNVDSSFLQRGQTGTKHRSRRDSLLHLAILKRLFISQADPKEVRLSQSETLKKALLFGTDYTAGADIPQNKCSDLCCRKMMAAGQQGDFFL